MLNLKKIEERKKYLIDKFGEEIFKTSGVENIPKNAVYPRYPNLNELLSSKQSFDYIESRLEQSYLLTFEKKGQYFKELTRRNFLKAAGVILAIASIPFGLTGVKKVKADNLLNENSKINEIIETTSHNPEFEKNYPTGVPTTDIDKFYTDYQDSSIVGIVKGGNYEYKVRKAIELAGGLDDILPGQTVCIKPNNVIQTLDLSDIDHKAPTCTNSEIVRQVIRCVVEKNEDPTKIFISERAALLSPTLLHMMLSGIYDVAIEEGVNLLPWENRDYIEFTHSKCQYLTEAFKIPESIRTFDHFINVPVMKNHEMASEQAEFTANLKAFVGVMHPSDRLSLKYTLHSKNFCEKITELNLCRPYTTMNIIDATEIVLMGGPAYPWMKFANPDIVVASKDRVACDALGLAVLKHYGIENNIDRPYVDKTLWEQKQLVNAEKLGFGYANPDKIQVFQENVDIFNRLMELFYEKV